jgi:hypothetical protein
MPKGTILNFFSGSYPILLFPTILHLANSNWCDSPFKILFVPVLSALLFLSSTSPFLLVCFPLPSLYLTPPLLRTPSSSSQLLSLPFLFFPSSLVLCILHHMHLPCLPLHANILPFYPFPLFCFRLSTYYHFFISLHPLSNYSRHH